MYILIKTLTEQNIYTIWLSEMTRRYIKVKIGKDDIIKFLKHSTLIMFIIISIQMYLVSHTVYHDIARTMNIVSKIERVDGMNLGLLCNFTSCEMIEYKGVTYKVDARGVLKKTFEKIVDNNFWSVARKLKSVVSCPNEVTIQVDISDYIKESFWVLVQSIGMFFLLFTILQIRNIISEKKNLLLRDKKNNVRLENKLQKIIAESAHHEMMLPVATIKTMSTELYEAIKERRQSELYAYKKCELINKGDCGCGIEKNMRRASDSDEDAPKDVVDESFNRIIDATEQLEAVLDQMAENKQFKYSNGDKSIYDLVVNIDKNLRTFRVDSRYKLKIKTPDVLKKYSLGGTLTNGQLLNFINNHFNNSVEAKSTTILVEAYVANGKMKLFITDNGIGIRDKYNNILHKQNTKDCIFKDGVSGKDENGNLITIEKLSIFSIAGIKQKINDIFGESDASSRGVGLFLNRQTLIENNGSLDLMETSTRGTTFRLTFDVNEKK